jgi:hypothetical protein
VTNAESDFDETTALSSALPILREYAARLTAHCDELATLRRKGAVQLWLWLWFCLLLVVAEILFVRLGHIYSDKLYAAIGGWFFVSALGLTVILGVIVYHTVQQKLSTLRKLIRKELILNTRIVTFGSQVLENAKISSLDAFALEIILFENEQAMNAARKTLGDPSSYENSEKRKESPASPGPLRT